jgi:sugar (pentulose or hexulose) kinase
VAEDRGVGARAAARADRGRRGAAFGAALLGGVAGGLWASPSEAAEAVVRPTSTVEPVAEWVSAYAEGRERFRALYPAIRDVATPLPRSA